MCFLPMYSSSMDHYTFEELYHGMTKRWKVTLLEEDLWQQFHKNETEMIITKPGRKMFPELNVKISGLDPQASYDVRLEIDLQSQFRFKYSTSSGWTPGGKEEHQSPKRIYVHPDSPATGERWMTSTVEFKKVKITNSVSTAQSSSPLHVLELSSMHKYRPKIVITQMSPTFPSRSFTFPETEFIAVTAYQNDKITQLKIDHNRFAKGFRENGKSNKRRRAVAEETSNSSSEDSSPSPSSPELSQSPRTPPSIYYPMRTNPLAMMSLPYYANQHYYPDYYRFPLLSTPLSHYYPLVPKEQPQDLSVQANANNSNNTNNRRFTDFSIESIIA